MITSERQAGGAEKGEGEVPLPPDARETPVRRLTQRCDVGGGMFQFSEGNQALPGPRKQA